MQGFLLWNGKGIEYTIEYRKRKTVGLSVSQEHGVRVSAPKWVSKKQIQGWIEEKAPWILSKLAELAEKPRKAALESGTIFPLLGLDKIFEIREEGKAKRAKILFDQHQITAILPIGLSLEEKDRMAVEALTRWYKERAGEVIRNRVEIFSNVMGVQPEKITIKQQKTRWGSCSSKGNININWKLVMMPESVVDYVIVHELAHLRVMNHGKEFWQLVASVLEDYPLRRKLLKEREKQLNF